MKATEQEEFEKFLCERGIASNYLGDGQYSGGNQLAYEARQACAAQKDKEIAELREDLK